MEIITNDMVIIGADLCGTGEQQSAALVARANNRDTERTMSVSGPVL